VPQATIANAINKSMASRLFITVSTTLEAQPLVPETRT